MEGFTGITLITLGTAITTLSLTLGIKKLIFKDSITNLDLKFVSSLEVQKLEINLNTTQNSHSFQFKLPNNAPITEEMTIWECILEGEGLEEGITELKSSLKKKFFLYKFIHSCIYSGSPWRPKPENNKLTRKITIKDPNKLKEFYSE